MKIVKYGTVTITEGPIKVEGWLVEPEASDPVDVTPEQMLLAFVITWARKKFDAEANKAYMSAVKDAALRKALKGDDEIPGAN